MLRIIIVDKSRSNLFNYKNLIKGKLILFKLFQAFKNIVILSIYNFNFNY
jgi:hypothetical protein